MSQAKVRWLQRVAGREEGHVEVIETDTPFIKGCIANGRLEILITEAPTLPPPAAPTRGSGSAPLDKRVTIPRDRERPIVFRKE